MRAGVRSDGALSIVMIFVSSPKEPPKPRRKSIGTPTTIATSAPLSAVERAREKASSWSAGTQPRAWPLANTGTRRCCTSARRAVSPCAQYRPVPAMITGRRAPASRSIACSTPSAAGAWSGSATRTSDGGSSSSSMNTTSSGKSTKVGPVGAAIAPTIAWSTSAGISAVEAGVRALLVSGATNGTWSISCREP